MPKLKLSTDKKIRIQASLNRQKKAFKNSFKENDISKAVINKYRYYSEGINTAVHQILHPIETTKGAVKQAIDSNIYTQYGAQKISEARLKLKEMNENGGLGSWASDSFSKNFDKVNNKFSDIKNQVAENGVAGYSKTLALNGIKGALNGSKTAAKTLAKATGAAGLARAGFNTAKKTSEAVKRKFNAAKRTATAPIRAVNKVKSGVGKAKDEFNAIKKDPGNYLLGLAATVPGAAKKLAEKARNSKIVKKTLEIVKKVMNVISIIWKPLLIGYIIITVSLGVMSGLSMVHVTPHYYCDLDAPKLVKKTKEYKKYCVTKQGNDSIAEAAVSLAGFDQDTTTPDNYCGGVSVTTTYRSIFNQIFSDFNTGGYTAGQSCDRSAATAVRWSGADDNFPEGPTSAQIAYMQANPDKWEYIGNINSSNYMSAQSMLEPGDIMIYDGHVAIFTGPELIQEKWPGASERYNTVQGSIGANMGPTATTLYGDGSHMGLGLGSEYDYMIFRNINSDTESIYSDLESDDDSCDGTNDPIK